MKVLSRQVLSDGAYDLLKLLILDQEVEPGEWLSIDALAARLGVSQTPVREALARLEGDRLVVKRAQGGYEVAPMLDARAFEYLFHVRLLLEPDAAALAAKAGSVEQFERMEAEIDAMCRAGTRQSAEYKEFAGSDFAFHALIAEATQNEFLYDAVVRLRSHHQLARLYFRRGIVDAEDAIVEHKAILETLVARDAGVARELMYEHVGRSRLRLAQLLESVAAEERLIAPEQKSVRAS